MYEKFQLLVTKFRLYNKQDGWLLSAVFAFSHFDKNAFSLQNYGFLIEIVGFILKLYNFYIFKFFLTFSKRRLADRVEIKF